MELTSYLQQYVDPQQLTLVGPLYRGPGCFAEPVIFVDRGVAFRKGKEGFSVGDGDSSGHDLDEMLPTDKDISDLGYALKQIPDSFNSINLLGFLGGRRDHEWFNMGEVNEFLIHAPAATRASFDNEIFALGAGSWTLKVNGMFSLACLQSTSVVLSGKCRYHIKSGTKVIPFSSFGLSNEGSGRISLHTDGPVFILCSVETTHVTNITYIKNSEYD